MTNVTKPLINISDFAGSTSGKQRFVGEDPTSKYVTSVAVELLTNTIAVQQTIHLETWLALSTLVIIGDKTTKSLNRDKIKCTHGDWIVIHKTVSNAEKQNLLDLQISSNTEKF